MTTGGSGQAYSLYRQSEVHKHLSSKHKHLSSKLDGVMIVMQRVPREPGESATDTSGAPISPIYMLSHSPRLPLSPCLLCLSCSVLPTPALPGCCGEAAHLLTPQQLPVSFPLLYPSLQPAFI